MRLGALGETRQPQEQIEVARHRASDPRTQHLDRDFRALGRDREMHLRDRGGGDRGIVKRGEKARGRLLEFRLDQGARLSAGKGRQAVLQLR